MSGGILTLEALNRAFDELWNLGRAEPHAVLLSPSPPRCVAELFTPHTSYEWLRLEVITTGTPVHPDHAAYFDPHQGPAPLACALKRHPEGTWHWDGRGTWFR